MPERNSVASGPNRTDQGPGEGNLGQLDRLRESLQNVCAAISQLVKHQTYLSSETAALSNRYAGVEENLASAMQRQEELSRNLEELRMRSLVFQSEVTQRVNLLENRCRLFTTVSDDGVFLLKGGDLISDRVQQCCTWDQHIVQAMEASINGRKELAVDVGAHIGLLTVPLARRFQRVLAFEPNEFNHRLLTANVALNGLSNVQCIKLALYSASVELSLAKSEQQEIAIPLTPEGRFDWGLAANLGAYSFCPEGTGIFSGPARTLDSYNLDDLSFLKIDAQGADGEVIMGALETLRRCHPIIIFEWEDELSKTFKVSLAHVERQLEKEGYSLRVLKEYNSKQRDFLCVPQSVV